ncbi:hypothetical protein BC943DRAFT_363763 [Umbelopsis sp. AD052]|nr:hypothetical protein BC943DRAFT_363763 [Umbelopsis sp. AD052]
MVAAEKQDISCLFRQQIGTLAVQEGTQKLEPMKQKQKPSPSVTTEDEDEPREWYQQHFDTTTTSLRLLLQDIQENPPEERPAIDDLAASLNNSIYDSLTTSLGDRTPRPKQQWQRASEVDKIQPWYDYQTAKKQFHSSIKAARRQAWKSYCEAMARDFIKTISKVKVLRRQGQQHVYNHPARTTEATKVMVQHLAKVCDGTGHHDRNHRLELL